MFNNHKPLSSKRLLASIISTLAISTTLAAHADSEKLDLTIKSQKAGPALVELGEKSGVQILFPNQKARTIKLMPLDGSYTLTEALDAILRESGLIYEFTSDTTVVIKEAGSNIHSEEAEEVEEVVVTGQRIVTRNRINSVEPTLVYDSAYFERYEPLTLNDMLKRVPGVFFDQLFNAPANTTTTAFTDTGGRMPRFRNLGSQFSQILINGRRIAGIDFGFGGDDFLATLPAESVKEIRVIRSPSAELDSSGVGMTLNVILKDGNRYSDNSWRLGSSYLDGVTEGVGSVNLRGSTDSFNYSLSITAQNRAGSSKATTESTGESTFQILPFFDTITDSHDISTTDAKELEEDRNVIGNIGFDLSDSSTLNIEGKYVETTRTANTRQQGVRTEITTGSEFGIPVDSTPVVEEIFGATDTTRNTKNYGLAVTYGLDLDTFTWESVIGYDLTDLSASNLSRDRDSDTGGIFDDALNESSGEGKRIVFNNRFSYQLSDYQEIRFGSDWLHSKDINGNTQFDYVNDNLLVFSDDRQTVEKADYYLVYEWELAENITWQIGGRYETTEYESAAPPRLLMRDIEEDFQFDPDVISEQVSTPFSAKVSGFNPSTHLRWSFMENHDLKLSVARTVRRPNLGELDPEITALVDLDGLQENAVSLGNPDLENEESLGFDIGYDWRFEGGVIGINFFKRKIENLIEEAYLPLADIAQLRPDVADEVFRLQDYLLGLAAPMDLALKMPLNSNNEVDAHGVELDVSFPLTIISDTAQFYMNATYSSQTETGEPANRSSAVNLSYDHLIEPIGLTYGASVNWITKDQRHFEILGSFIEDSTRDLDPNLEVFVEKKLGEKMLVRLTVENLLDAEHVSVRDFSSDSSYFSFSTDQVRITESDPRLLLTFRGKF